MNTRWVTCLIGCALAIAGSPALAEADSGLVVVSGSAPAPDRKLVNDAVMATLRGAGWVFGDKPLTAKQLAATGDCVHRSDAAACVGRNLHVERLAFVVVAPEPMEKGGMQTGMTGRMYVASTNTFVISQRFCEHCTDDVLTTLGGSLAQDLLDKVGLATGRTVLSIKSMPPGARFYIDGKVMGATDASIEVVPGTRKIAIEHDGFARVTRTVEAEEGKTVEVAVTLEPATAADPHPTPPTSHPPPVVTDPPPHVEVPPPPPPATHRSRVLPAVMMGVGITAVVGGVVAILFDGSSGTDPNQQQSPTYRDTVAPGVGIAAGGVVVGGIGAYLWSKYSSSSTAVLVAPTAGGSVVGISGTF